MVGEAGLEPARIAPQDPKSCASANSATRPLHLGRLPARHRAAGSGAGPIPPLAPREAASMPKLAEPITGGGYKIHRRKTTAKGRA